MIYDKVQEQLKPLEVPPVQDWRPEKGTPLAAALERLAQVQEEKRQMDVRHQERRRAVEAEVQEAQQAAVVTAGSSPSSVAVALLTVEQSKPILAEIQRQVVRENGDFRIHKLMPAEQAVTALAQPLLTYLGGYNEAVGEYWRHVRMPGIDNRKHGEHRDWVACQLALAQLTVWSEYVALHYNQIVGRKYRGEWGPLFGQR